MSETHSGSRALSLRRGTNVSLPEGDIHGLNPSPMGYSTPDHLVPQFTILHHRMGSYVGSMLVTAEKLLSYLLVVGLLVEKLSTYIFI